jgi:hypothetical protein
MRRARYAMVLFIAFVAVMMFPRNIRAESLLIMAWDGAGLTNVRRLLGEGKLPSLQGFVNSGAILAPVEIHTKTATVASFAVFFSGLSYDQTGVMGNWYLKKRKSGVVKYNVIAGYNYDTYQGHTFWTRPLPYEWTLFRYLEDKGLTFGFIVSKKYFTTSEVAPFNELAAHADFYGYHDPKHEGDEIYIYNIRDDAVRFIQSCKDASQDFVLFVHTDPDKFGHKNGGENGLRYEEEFIRSDTVLGTLLETIPEGTKVVVLTDHGFDEAGFTHHNAPDAWMATNLNVHTDYALKVHEKQRAVAAMRDMLPTILEYYGIDYSAFMPQIRGKSLLK